MTQVRSYNSDSNAKVAFLPPPIVLGNHQVMAGANSHYKNTVIVQSVDFGVLARVTTATAGEEFAERFLQRFTGLKTFLQNSGINSDFIDTLKSEKGASFQQVLLEAIIAVESAVAFATHELKTVSHAGIQQGETRAVLVWECLTRPTLSTEAAQVALRGINELLPQIFKNTGPETGVDFDSSLQKLCQRAGRRRVAPSTAVIKYTAELNNIPCQLLNRQHLLLGQGKNQQQVYASMTGSTTIAAQKICADKRQTNRRLKEMRLPVPRQFKAGSIEDARKAAEKCNYPVVIKPVRGRKGQGITVGVRTVKALDQAFLAAHKKGKDVVVEEYISGSDCRLLVIDGKFVAAVQRQPPTITGDGTSTVQSLIDTLNNDAYRDGFRGFRVSLDDEVMARIKEAGFGLNDVPARGKKVILRAASNVSTGGIPIDVTDQVHPENRDLAVRAAGSVGLDVAGIDILTSDISRPYHQTDARILEINARPGLDIHIWPRVGKSRNVAQNILRLSFPKNDQGRIPVYSVAGDNGIGSAARILDMILRSVGQHTGLAMRKHSYLNGESVSFTDSQQSKASQILLSDPHVETLVNTVSLRQTAKSGMQIDGCSIAVIMDRIRTGGANLFNKGMDVVIEAASDGIVIGAGNLIAMEKIARLDATKRIVLVSDRANNPDLIRHLKKGGDAVTTLWHNGEKSIALLSGEKMLTSTSFSAGTRNDGKIRKKRLNTALMYAIGAAYASGLSAEKIMLGLEYAPPVVPEETD